jgi:SLT domain-containing protein
VAEEHRVAQLATVRARVVVAAPVAPTGTHADWMLAAGIDPANFGYVDYIVTHESGWRWWITNNEGSGATGLGQALPASKMAAYGADYLTNPITQLRWAQAYAIGRYGSWAAAYGYWVAHRVW